MMLRVLSMTMGQPMLISKSLVGTATFCDLKTPDSDLGALEQETQSLEAFTATV